MKANLMAVGAVSCQCQRWDDALPSCCPLTHRCHWSRCYRATCRHSGLTPRQRGKESAWYWVGLTVRWFQIWGLITTLTASWESWIRVELNQKQGNGDISGAIHSLVIERNYCIDDRLIASDIFQEKMSNICRFQLLKSEDLLDSYDIEWNILDHWLDKMIHLKTSLSALENCDEPFSQYFDILRTKRFIAKIVVWILNIKNGSCSPQLSRQLWWRFSRSSLQRVEWGV